MPPERIDHNLVAEVLERMIDSQISNTQALTSLKGTLDETNIRTKDIDGFFRNGFRSDIKRIVEHIDLMQKNIENTNESLTRVYHQTKEIKEQNKFWSRFSAIVLAIGAVAAAVVQFTG